MPGSTVPQREQRAIVVVGLGAVAVATAIALAQAGLPVTLVGEPPPSRPGRTVALLDGSVDFIKSLGVWPALATKVAPLRAMRIVDATPSLFRPPPVLFEARDVGLQAFGVNVANDHLERALRAAARDTAGLTFHEARVTDFRADGQVAEVIVADGGRLSATLVIAADGRRSRCRQAARIGTRTTAHPQRAMTALLTHDRPHDGISTEFHTRQGPFTLVPLPAAEGDDKPCSSLVWVMSLAEAERRNRLGQDAFAREAEQQCRLLLGRMQVVGPIGTFPIVTSIATRLVANRLALVGEAAHALPPIGAQGLNLSFRDVAALVQHVRQGDRAGMDIGDLVHLQAYARLRAGDVASRAGGVGLLNSALLTETPLADLARGVGLGLLGQSAPLRRFAMRHGLTAGHVQAT